MIFKYIEHPTKQQMLDAIRNACCDVRTGVSTSEVAVGRIRELIDRRRGVTQYSAARGDYHISSVR